MDVLLTPPIAFMLYIPLVLLIAWLGRQLAGPERPSIAKSSSYGGGEKAPTIAAAPGYRPFFLVAFFFAILHLGMLVLGMGNLSGHHAVYIIGLVLALLALILG
jgi:NADH:ubiquinone oxidoreductase subunit 3 (subunit A)